jgi:hypothetical protein
MSKADFSGMKDFHKYLLESTEATDEFFIACTKELAARFLRKAIKRTPVGTGAFDAVYEEKTAKGGKKKRTLKLERLTNGGTLRRGWTAKTEQEAKNGSGGNAAKFVQEHKVDHSGGVYAIVLINPVSYASYVEYGHRQQVGRFVPQLGKRLKKSWVTGRFMMTDSNNELQTEIPSILKKKLAAFLEGGKNG